MTSDLYGKLITSGCFASTGAIGVAALSVPVEAAKRLHPRFAMSGTNADVWLLSPQDWSTG